jgi:uncharacterized alpha-E superfamily protein
MLARAAEGIYWVGRYTERAEGTARVVATHANLFFDIPVSAGVGWEPLLAITGTWSRYDDGWTGDGPRPVTESDVVRFLVTDHDNPSSIVSSLGVARNNIRSCRQRLPYEAWEAMNRLYLFAEEAAPAVEDRSGRFRYLDHLVAESQKLTGILHGMMTRDAAYAFFMLGQNLERADMTTRVLDVHAELLALRGGTQDTRYDDVLWMYALKSVAAFQMYRRAGAATGTAARTLRFLLQDQTCPRSVAFCLQEVAHQLKGLSGGDDAVEACAGALRCAHDRTPDTLEGAALHAFVDELQQQRADVDRAIHDTWLHVAVAGAGVPAGV